MDIKHLDKLTNEKWLNLYAATFENRGHTGRWVFASRRDKPLSGTLTSDAVVIVPVLRSPNEPPRLVLLKEFRVPVGGYIYGLPAGLLEAGESVEEAVRREMAEETGLEVVTLKRVSPMLLSTAGVTDEAAVMAYVDVRGNEGVLPQLDASEDIEVLLLDYAQVSALCDDASIWVDAKAWLVLYTIQQLGRIE